MAAGQPRQQDGAVGAHLQKGHRPAQRDMGRLRGGRHRLGLDRRDTPIIGRHLVSATPDATPRALKLVAKNVQHAERLIEQGHMQPAGLVHVDAARSDGRWATAYAGSATMVMPEVF